MVTPVLKNKTLVAIVEEVTEGVPVDPSVGAEFIQVLDGISNDPAKELVERAVITPLKGKIQPRTSIKSSSGSMPCEWKASGTEGAADLELDVAYRSLLGDLTYSIGVRPVIEVGSTASQFVITGHGLVKGQFLHILEAGAHHMAFVSNVVDVDTFDIVPPMPSAPSVSTEIALSETYYANDNEPTFTETIYWGDITKEQIEGVRIASGSFENITTGQTPGVTFSTQGLNFTELKNTPSAVVPVYNNILPPIALNAIVAMDDDCIDMDELSFTIENEIANLTSVKSPNGSIASRVSGRTVTGSLSPYLDGVSDVNFDRFNENTNFSVVVAMALPSETTPGEFELGSCIGSYMPQCIFTSLPKADKDGVLTQAGEFQAHTGATGVETEIFLGFS